jgi:hypothetical protein
MRKSEFVQKLSIFNDDEIIKFIGPDNTRYSIWDWDRGTNKWNNTIIFYICGSAEVKWGPKIFDITYIEWAQQLS